LIRIITQQPRWLLSIVLFGFALAIGLILLGAKGSELTGPLGLLVSIISIAIAIKYRPRASDSEGGSSATPEPAWQVKIAIISVIVLMLGISVGVFYATVIHKVDLRVTDQIKITNGRNISNGKEATVNILVPPLGREFVAMTLRLSNPDKTGNCVGPTSLEVAPIIDGSVKNPLPRLVASMEEFRLGIAQAKRAAVQVKTVNETEGCRLDLEVADAVLYNDFP
jgi:hypothetical protein